MTVRELLRIGTERLRNRPDLDPGLEARVLLKRLAGFTEIEILAYPERPVPGSVVRRFEKAVDARRGGVPLAHLLGEKEFWSIPMTVSPAVLVPRPETELLVERALAWASRPDPWIVEIGTGSGCVAVALAKELPGARITAVERSARALSIARANAARHGASNVDFIRGDLFAALGGRGLEGRADLVVSNPPYLSAEEWASLEPGIRDHEPRAALVAGPTGLETIRRLVRGAARFLSPAGAFLVEIGSGQAEAVRAMFGPAWTEVRMTPDLAGILRVAEARLRP